MIGILIAAWLDVRSKPLRTFAAIAGMVAAVTAVILVDAAAVLSRNANQEYIARTYGRTATISIFPTGNGGPGGVALDEDQESLPAWLAANGVSRVSTNVDLRLVLINGSEVTDASARWVSSSYSDVAIVDLIAGAFPVETARSPAIHAVLSLEMAQRLGYAGPDVVGKTFWYAAGFDAGGADLRTAPLSPLVVDAVAESLGSGPEGSQLLLVSDLPRPELLDNRGVSWLVHVNPADVFMVNELVTSFTPSVESGDPALMSQRIDQGVQLAPVLSQQRVTAAAVTWVALLVGGLGILGVGLASVRERGMDFGLRRALGASTRRVFTGVIVQTMLEVLLAAAIAIPLAAIAVELFARQLVLETLPLPSSTGLPLSSALRGIIAALAVGLLAGLLPAFRAARASVVQALRG